MSTDMWTRLANALDALSAYVRHEPLCKAGMYPGIGKCSCGLTSELENKLDLVAALEASAGAGTPLVCPFDAGQPTGWWSCSCGAEHQLPPPPAKDAL